MRFLKRDMVTLEKTCTNSTAIPSINPFITVVEIPTAGHMESASLKIGFSLKMPLEISCMLDLSFATSTSSYKN
jgi:hypothetical protein